MSLTFDHETAKLLYASATTRDNTQKPTNSRASVPLVFAATITNSPAYTDNRYGFTRDRVSNSDGSLTSATTLAATTGSLALTGTLTNLAETTTHNLIVGTKVIVFTQFDQSTPPVLRYYCFEGSVAGKVSSPYTMLADQSTSNLTAQTDTWSITTPPEGTFGVNYSGSRLVYDPATFTLFEFFRQETFNSAGLKTFIGAESKQVVITFVKADC